MTTLPEDIKLPERAQYAFVHDSTRVGYIFWPWGQACCPDDRVAVLRLWVNGDRGFYAAPQLLWPRGVMVSIASSEEFLQTMKAAMQVADFMAKAEYVRGEGE